MMLPVFYCFIGAPLPPTISLDVTFRDDDSCFHTLSWTPPFSLSELPVAVYTIVLSNYSYGEPFNTSRTIVVESNETDPYLVQFNSTGNKCYRLTFSVSANNSLGEGKSAVLHSGHPIIGN